jgi:DNA polymerase iota
LPSFGILRQVGAATAVFPVVIFLLLTPYYRLVVTLRNLEQWLDPRTGKIVWSLLHGIDDTEVKAAADVPTQISIEDTYQGLNEASEISSELRKLAVHLLERMQLDLVEDDHWLAYPRTLRLSARPKTRPSEDKPYNFARKSKSQPLPSYLLNLSIDRDEVVDRLLQQALLPMFYQLNPDKSGWRIGMLNVCVANMVLTGTENGSGVGRNISSMFRKQEETLREFTVYATEQGEEGEDTDVWDDGQDGSSDQASLEGRDAFERCAVCGHAFPHFALAAHERYHTMENG